MTSSRKRFEDLAISKNVAALSHTDTRVGVTIITGFLGSGKSTLIRRILTEEHGLRIVVVENEFGANSSVEEAIVTQGVGPSALEQFIELPNGCICCASQEELTDALSRLLRSRPGKIDHILIEASGLADPGPVAASFWVDEELETGLELNAVVAVADAVNVEPYLHDGEGESEKARITQKQLAMADLVLLNKVDLLGQNSAKMDNGEGNLGKKGVEQLEQLLRDVGCTAKIARTTRCDVDLSVLLNIHAYDNRASEKLLFKSEPAKFAQHLHSKGSVVGSVTVTFKETAFNHSLLDRVIGQLLWEREEGPMAVGGDDTQKREIWRMKALVKVDGETFKRIYQSVDALFEHSASSIEASECMDRDNTSCFIFIGRSLCEENLRASLLEAVAKP